VGNVPAADFETVVAAVFGIFTFTEPSRATEDVVEGAPDGTEASRHADRLLPQHIMVSFF
jgi:hypothetical protein